MALEVTDMLKQLIENILNSRDAAVQFVDDPQGTLAVQGITEQDLTGVDTPALIGQVAATCDLPADTKSALQSYGSGGSGYSGGGSGYAAPAATHTPSVEQVMQNLTYAVSVTYSDDDYISQQITNIDNSVNTDVDGNVFGDLDIDATSVTATGDGAVANAGDGDVTAATGDGSLAAGDDLNAAVGAGSQVIDGDNFGQANTGDGAAQVFGDNDGVVNTGINTGVLAGDDATNSVVGDGNQTAQVDGDAEGSAFNFGDGDVANINDSEIDDSAVAFGDGDASNAIDSGNSTNVVGSTVGQGGAVSSGSGDATGSFQDNDQDNDVTTTFDNDDFSETNQVTNTVTGDQASTQTELGAGDADQDPVNADQSGVVNQF